MSTQTLNLDTALGLYSQRPSGEYMHMPSIDLEDVRYLPTSDFVRLNEPLDWITRLAIKYTTELKGMNSDGRLDYVRAANLAISEDHIGQLALLTHRDWLDHPARNRMRAIARELAQEHRHPGAVLRRWLSEGDFDRFYQALGETDFPDQIIATCYALCEASDLAYVSYRTQEDRLRPGVPMPRIIQTPEEIAADLRFVRAL